MSDTEVQAALARVEACLGEERPRDAVPDLQKILAVFPNHPMALCGVGRVSIQLGDNAAALQALDLALEQDPNLAEARNARGAALQNLARLDEAEIEFRRLVADVPGHPGPLLNLAATLTAKNDLSSAEQILAQVLELAPGNPTATYNLGLLHLLKGDLASGWRGFECRDLASNVGPAAFRSPKPRWRGEAVDDKTLVILAEQGLGDNIQFARFVPLAAQRAAKVIWEVPEPLVGLFGNPAPGVTVLKRGDPLPEHDLFVPIMSLAGVLRPNGKIEWPGPYVSADPRLVSQWRDRLSRAADAPLHVGLVWAGNPDHKRDRERSVALSELAPLLDVPGVALHSLQIGPAAEQAAAAPFAGAMKPVFRRPRRFPEVAAVVSALDLLIGVDTSLVHLAGAMGRPVWTMTTFVPDWRWMLDRSDSPWYPSMRLFRQQEPGNWSGVARDVAASLKVFASSGGV